MARSSLWLALLVHPSLAPARSALDTTGYLKLFSLGTFPAPYENEVPGSLLGASGSSVVDGRLKLLWRPRRALRLELHPTLTLTQGQASLGLDTGVARGADELLPLSFDWVDDPQLSLRARPRSCQPALGHPSIETHPGSPAGHLREGAFLRRSTWWRPLRRRPLITATRRVWMR